ncbi:hypothetical protein CDD83_1479 [Cordyceps sp. RAO-2017]|nr:hypothetical protein CDD83_1479 [Cordyceps sp. RAO-2017]
MTEGGVIGGVVGGVVGGGGGEDGEKPHAVRCSKWRFSMLADTSDMEEWGQSRVTRVSDVRTEDPSPKTHANARIPG